MKIYAVKTSKNKPEYVFIPYKYMNETALFFCWCSPKNLWTHLMKISFQFLGFHFYLFIYLYLHVCWLLKSLCVLSFMALGPQPKPHKKKPVCFQDRRKRSSSLQRGTFTSVWKEGSRATTHCAHVGSSVSEQQEHQQEGFCHRIAKLINCMTR